ncbi:hypothetical protein EG328_002135 [Venturia inaequalis]|uniref:Uncharacterized protein n=1 Tax=Venturia inaequalis TaxID=5025 RepID=A0A8H3Z2A9_VENIN|nr:hypothetical protein EG328_002135 [Venturia inaequalis]
MKVNISYIIQVVLAILFGPIYALVYKYRELLCIEDEFEKRLIALQKGFLDASAQFTIPVAVASVVRLKQSAPLYEITFLESLTSMQFMALLATSVATGIGPHQETRMKGTVIALYSVLDFCLYISIVAYLRTSKSRWESLGELSKACAAYGSNLLPGFVYFQSHNPVPKITAKEYFSWTSKRALVKLFEKKKRRQGTLGFVSLGLSVGMLYYAIKMESQRNHIKAILGKEFLDDQWGFGQVVALCLWIPLLLQTIYTILKSLGLAKTEPVSDPEGRRVRPQCSKADYCLQNATGSASLPAEPRHDIDPDEIKVQPSASTKEVDPSTSFVSASPQIPPELSNETEETVKQTGPGFQVLASGYKGKINAKVNEPTGTATHHGNPSKKPRTF